MCIYAKSFANIGEISISVNKMKLRTIIAYICTILLAIQASGSPARRGPIALTQPDGTTFTALISGDESARIKTTLEGCAIMQNEDLWWCYATYDSEGNKYCTEWHVGSQAPASVISSSRSIPRAEIAASAKRSSAGLTLMNSTISDTAPSERTVNSGIVILAQFKDIQFLHSKEEFEAMLMSEGYDRHGATGSAREYFEAQFGGRLDFTFDVSDIVTLPGKREYYGSNDSKGNDIRPAEMIADACQLAAEIGNVKFSNYDNNNDGKVDNVFVFFAGEDEAEGADETSIWSHSWHLFRGAGLTLELDGKMIDRYACTAEMTRIYDHSSGKLLDTRICGIGTFCHEYCHTFGLPDMYDTDYDNLGGWSAGLWGHTSIMDSGNQNNEGNTPPNFNAIEREILGLSEPAVIETDGRYTLTPVQTSGAVYRLNAEQEGEYYLFECRSDKNDIWDKHIGGSGMLVYHIDKTPSAISRWEGLNTVNTDAGHQCADLIEADGRSDTFADYWDYMAKRDNIGGIFFPYSSTSNILAHGKPGLNFWSGDAGDLSVTEIQKEDDGRITFVISSQRENARWQIPLVPFFMVISPAGFSPL